MSVSLVITRGLMGSGKTTWANQTIESLRAKGDQAVRISRDDIRKELYGVDKSVLDNDKENIVTKVQQTKVKQFLALGFSVFVDDTNLNSRHARAWADLAKTKGVTFLVNDSFTELPLATVLERNVQRADKVPEEVILKTAKRYALPKKMEPVVATEIKSLDIETYVPDHNLPEAFIVDIDGTLALMDPAVGRSPYDGTLTHTDLPHIAVQKAIRAIDKKYDIVIMSGRSAQYKFLTVDWLTHHNIPYREIFMRANGDNRDDAIIKLELFNEHVRNNYDVIGVFDDRNRVVDMWRKLGLTCFQVAEGNF